MNKLTTERRVQIIRALVDGNSISAVCRIMGTEKRTVARLLVEVGTAAFEYQNRTLRNLPCQRIQCDEIWSYVGCKQKNVTPEKLASNRIVGDAWVWSPSTRIPSLFRAGWSANATPDAPWNSSGIWKAA